MSKIKAYKKDSFCTVCLEISMIVQLSCQKDVFGLLELFYLPA